VAKAKLMAKTTTKQFLKDLSLLSDEFRRKIDSEVSGFDSNPAECATRREKASQQTKEGFEFFARTYFPHYVKLPNSKLHNFLYERLPAILRSPKGQSDAIAAPRGEAKSTICSQIFVIWCVVNGWKHYPCIIMDAFDQAAIMLEAIKAEMEFNQRLAMDFPQASGQGRVWQSAVIITRNGVKIEAFGSGKKIRGRRHGPYRPDLVVLDDIENDENVANPTQRDKLERWLDKGVMKLGGADDKFDVLYIGTILHYDSVLSRKLKNPFWRRRSFKAILRWPDNMHLWDQWEEIVRNEDMELIREAEDEGREIADEELPSYQHYAAHRDEMDAGAEVSWPEGRPLFKLMWIRARDGHSSFDSEFQNDPLSAEDAPFAESIIFWVNRLNEWVMYGSCDPSMGKSSSRADPSAILVGGFNRNTGVLDVVEAAIKKRKPDRIISDVIEFQREYRCLYWFVEIVQFQEFLKDELVKRSAQLGVPVPAKGIRSHSDKDLRIESIQPHCANGLIRLHPRLVTLIEQLTHWPKADHDDGPDALEMLWTGAVSGSNKTYQGMRVKWL
jgi:predicted phage terminase large subunit-like protein